MDVLGWGGGAYTAVAYVTAPARIEVSFMMIVSFGARWKSSI